MKPALFLGLPCALLLGAVMFACGSSENGSGFGDGGASSSSSGGDDGSGSSGGDDGGCGLVCNGGDGAPAQCMNLQCGTDCSQNGKPQTTLTGTVRDPAGALPLYNIYVYIPNAKPDPIVPGNPTCTPCEAPASGSPVIGTLTDAAGKFTLSKGPNDQWPVPQGDNIPIVLQAGKWRRQLVIPHIDACSTVNLDTVLGPDKMRLPKQSSEGDMPLLAFTSGCDPAECFLRHIGIADSEFVGPHTPPPAAFPTVTPGTGHVHFFTANDVQGGGGSGSAVSPNGNTTADTYAWWGNSKNLLAYDIIFNACECNPNPRGGTAYGAMDAYLKGGGRLFTTHFYYNWFTPGTGTADLNSVAQWSPNGFGAGGGGEADTVDQSFPKGKAFAQWLQNNNISTSLGNITLNDTRDDVTAPAPAGCNANMSCLSTQWIVHPGDNHPRYLSFNTPVGATVDKQCGRAVFSDVHLSGASNDAVYPGECGTPDPNYAINEKALEFLFFDLSSCVQNDYKPPPPPTPQ